MPIKHDSAIQKRDRVENKGAPRRSLVLLGKLFQSRMKPRDLQDERKEKETLDGEVEGVPPTPYRLLALSNLASHPAICFCCILHAGRHSPSVE